MEAYRCGEIHGMTATSNLESRCVCNGQEREQKTAQLTITGASVKIIECSDKG
jgi:hypothetical protein